MSTINLGNVVGNKVVGISSGLDTESLITGLSTARKASITALTDKITLNNSKVSTVGSLNTLLTTLNSSLNYLRNPSGSTANVSNIFQYKTATLNSSNLTPANYLSVTANPGALVGNSNIEIGQLAKSLEMRSGSFSARDIPATTASSGSYFSAGTFQVGSAVATSVNGTTKSGFQLASGSYSVTGDATGILTPAGIKNITVTGASGGQTGLEGKISNFSGSMGTTDSVYSVTVGGVTYTSQLVDITQSVNSGHQGIAAGTTLTFTSGAGGANETSFQVTTASDFTIDATLDNVTAFAAGLKSAVADQSIYQTRRISNFTDANVKPPLTGLTSANISLSTNNFAADGSFGSISNFSVQKSTGSNGAISVTVNGEVYRATGLGTPLNGNLTLKSTTSDSELKLNLGDAGVSADLSTDAAANSFEKALDYSFGTRSLVNITVAAGDTLNDIIYNINAKTTQTGASASITKISDSDFRFSMKASNQGLDNAFDIFDSSSVLSHAGLTTTQNAQDSLIRVDGVEVSRSTNSISDVIENVTLNIQATTPNYNGSPDSINLQIGNDVDTVSAGVKSFLDAYNALRVFYSEQTARDSSTGTYSKDAILGGDSNLESLMNQMATIVTGIVNTSSTSYNSLSKIGISLQDYAGDDKNVATKNILVYDDSSLKTLLTGNYDKIREIFELKSTSSSNSLTVYKSSNQATLSNFKLDIDTSKPVGQQVKLLNSDGSDYLQSGQPVYLSASGQKITGNTGTPVEGLEFLYTGKGVETVNVSLTQGIADKLYNLANSYVKDGGVLDKEVDNINKTNTSYNDDVTSLQARLDSYVGTLRNKFNALEQALSSVNNILSFLDANTAAANAP